jgi:hypothetical protein
LQYCITPKANAVSSWQDFWHFVSAQSQNAIALWLVSLQSREAWQ